MEEKTVKDEIIEEIGNKSATEAMLNSEGGQRVLKGLKSEIVNAINEINSKYKTATHTELIALAAGLDKNWGLYWTFMQVPKAKRIAQQDLDDLLKEEKDPSI